MTTTPTTPDPDRPSHVLRGTADVQLLIAVLDTLALGGDHVTLTPANLDAALARAVTVWTDSDGNVCLRTDEGPF